MILNIATKTTKPLNKQRIVGRLLSVIKVVKLTKYPWELIGYLLFARVRRLRIMYRYFNLIHYPGINEISELDLVFSRGVYLQNLKRNQLNQTNFIIVDIGSNIGLSVLFFKTKYPNAKIFAYEPNPTVFDYLLDNVSINNLKDSVVCYKKAVVSSCLENNTRFFINSDSSLESSLYENYIPNRSKVMISVDTECLDNIVQQHKQIDILKIDAEGVEYSLVDTIIKNSHRIENIFIEFHLTLSTSPFKAIDQLSKIYNLSITHSNYHVLMIHGIHKSKDR